MVLAHSKVLLIFFEVREMSRFFHVFLWCILTPNPQIPVINDCSFIMGHILRCQAGVQVIKLACFKTSVWSALRGEYGVIQEVNMVCFKR